MPNFGDIALATDVATLWVPPSRILTINGISFDLSADRSWTVAGGTSAVTSVFGRAGAVVAQVGDYSGFYPLLSGSYADPAWITALSFSKLTGVPADEVTNVFGRKGAIVAQAGDYSGFYPLLSGSYNDPAWITGLSYSKLIGVPAAAVASVFGRTGAIAAQAGDYSGFYPQLTGTYVNPSWISSLPWSKITGAPSFEPALGNPASNGQILSSSIAGVRSWVNPGEPALGNPAVNGMMLASTTAGARSWARVTSVQGTTTNDDAVAGDVGEQISSNVTTGVAIANNTTGTIASINLSPGDWDVSATAHANILNLPSGAYCFATGYIGIGTAAGIVSGYHSNGFLQNPTGATQQVNISCALPSRRVKVAAPTAIYLTLNLIYSGGQGYGTGWIEARRRR